jgi:hypothetical protein
MPVARSADSLGSAPSRAQLRIGAVVRRDSEAEHPHFPGACCAGWSGREVCSVISSLCRPAAATHAWCRGEGAPCKPGGR